MAKKSPTLRALDLGFGFTKFSKGQYSDRGDGSLEVAAFPSYAAPAVDYSIGAGVMSDLSVVNISVDGERFTIGEDVRRAADGVGRQMLESTFFKSNQYLALARGAMASMNVPDHGEIDSLVMGLPLNVYRDKSIIEHVEAKLKGSHLVPDVGKDRGIERSIQSLVLFVADNGSAFPIDLVGRFTVGDTLAGLFKGPARCRRRGAV